MEDRSDDGGKHDAGEQDDDEQDPQEWMQRAYDPAAVITQVDDGHPAGPGERGYYITSSASQPDVVALMLAALDAQPGMRVLEIGTGTGYNAALLAHRLGADDYPVHQSGPRNLWDEIEAAYHWWRDAGRPGPQQWRITITPEGQQVTLTQASTPARALTRTPHRLPPRCWAGALIRALTPEVEPRGSRDQDHAICMPDLGRLRGRPYPPPSRPNDWG